MCTHECAWRCEFMEANTHGYLTTNESTKLGQSREGGESLTRLSSSAAGSVAGGLDCERPLPCCSPRLSMLPDEARARPFSWPQLQPDPTWAPREQDSSPWIPRTPSWEAAPQLTALTQTASYAINLACDGVCVHVECLHSCLFTPHQLMRAWHPSAATTRSSWMSLR